MTNSQQMPVLFPHFSPESGPLERKLFNSEIPVEFYYQVEFVAFEIVKVYFFSHFQNRFEKY